MDEKILAIIPARGGSKRVPKKNIKNLAGNPLISYTIEAAKESKYLDKIVVTTDSKEISKVSKSFGVDVINRPDDIADDKSPTIEAVFHVLNELKGEYDYVTVLQPTSPLRKSIDIDNSIKILKTSGSEECTVIGVCKWRHPPFWALKIENGKLIPLFEKYYSQRSQELPVFYRPNGAIFATTVENIRKNKTLHGPSMIPYEMPIERSIDIDDEMDFSIAELLTRKRYERD